MMLMELCEHGDLFELVARHGGIRDLPLLSHLFKQICTAVGALHTDLGLGHFDLKLENVLIGNDLLPKLCDFGFAGSLKKTFREVVGSASYVAPEVRNRCYSGPKPDLFSLGVMLFMMYFGRPPWLESSDRDAYFRAYRCRPEHLFKCGKIDQDLMNLTLSLLSFDPLDRPDSVYEVLKHPFFTSNLTDD